MTDVTTSDDVLTVDTLEDFRRAFDSDRWTNSFVINVATADSDGKHAKVEASYMVTLIPSVPGTKVLAINDVNFAVRRAYIEGHAATYYYEKSYGRGHLALSDTLELVLCWDHAPNEMPRRIDKVAVYRVVSISSLQFEAADIAQAS